MSNIQKLRAETIRYIDFYKKKVIIDREQDNIKFAIYELLLDLCKLEGLLSHLNVEDNIFTNKDFDNILANQNKIVQELDAFIKTPTSNKSNELANLKMEKTKFDDPNNLVYWIMNLSYNTILGNSRQKGNIPKIQSFEDIKSINFSKFLGKNIKNRNLLQKSYQTIFNSSIKTISKLNESKKIIDNALNQLNVSLCAEDLSHKNKDTIITELMKNINELIKQMNNAKENYRQSDDFSTKLNSLLIIYNIPIKIHINKLNIVALLKPCPLKQAAGRRKSKPKNKYGRKI